MDSWSKATGGQGEKGKTFKKYYFCVIATKMKDFQLGVNL